MDGKGGEGLGESRGQLLEILESLESSLETRAVVAFRRSPETFVREARTLELAIDPREKLTRLSQSQCSLRRGIDSTGRAELVAEASSRALLVCACTYYT